MMAPVHEGMLLIMFALLHLFGIGEPVPDVRLAPAPQPAWVGLKAIACSPKFPRNAQLGVCPDGYTGALIFEDEETLKDLPMLMHIIAHESAHLQDVEAGRTPMPDPDPWNEAGATKYACGITPIAACAVWAEQYGWG